MVSLSGGVTGQPTLRPFLELLSAADGSVLLSVQHKGFVARVTSLSPVDCTGNYLNSLQQNLLLMEMNKNVSAKELFFT